MHAMNIYALIPGGVNRKNNNQAPGARRKASGFGLKPQAEASPRSNGDTEGANHAYSLVIGDLAFRSVLKDLQAERSS
jgi:hypothetical protein